MIVAPNRKQFTQILDLNRCLKNQMMIRVHYCICFKASECSGCLAQHSPLFTTQISWSTRYRVPSNNFGFLVLYVHFDDVKKLAKKNFTSFSYFKRGCCFSCICGGNLGVLVHMEPQDLNKEIMMIIQFDTFITIFTMVI